MYAQTLPPRGHLICAEPPSAEHPAQVHCAEQQNQLLGAVATPWTMRLADDDVLFAHHIETLWPATEKADVIYSFDASGSRPRVVREGNDLASLFQVTNWIDGSAVLYRTSLLRSVGGWPTRYEGTVGKDFHFVGSEAAFEDWACFYELARAGARFLCVPKETWWYNDGRHDRISRPLLN